MNTVNKPLIDNISDYDIILFPIGINNAMQRGLAYEIGLNFPEVKEAINSTPYCNQKKYGTIHCVKVGSILFGGCFIHNGGFKKNDGEFIRYDSLTKCMQIANKHFKGKKVACPIMGCNPEDGNGNKERIIEILEKECTDIDLTVFDYVQRDFSQYIYNLLCACRRMYKEGTIGKNEYIDKRNHLLWIKKHGHLTPMPEGYNVEPKRKGKKIRVTKELLKK